MKTGRKITGTKKTGAKKNSNDSTRAFALLAIALAKGAANSSGNGKKSAPESDRKNSSASYKNPNTKQPSPRKFSMLSFFRLRNYFATSLLGTALLTGCMTTDPNTGEQKVSHTTKDAGIGAIAGAVLGAATSSKHDRAKGALIGAALGGGVGAAVGHHTDKQEAELRKKLENSGVEVQRQGDTINLVVPGNISFATNSAQLTPNFYESLNKVATSLKDYPDTTVQIVGHTDSTGAAAYNQQLSLNRANAVVVYLTAQGVAKERMQALGMGASQPVGDNKTADGRAQNRRVEIKIIPRETATPSNG